MTKKRLILFFDGTWMNVANETNVYLLAKKVCSFDNQGMRQKFFYSPGVGTNTLSRIPGGVAGFGLNENLLNGYEWLCQNYDDGDEIWIFGFSRGAYTARSLSGMIRKSGLLYITNDATLDQALSNYRTKDNDKEATEFRFRFSREVRIHFLGVWDTVGALGIPYFRLMNRNLQWHDTQLSGIVERAYHAMAIDEHREIFSSTPWVNPTKASPREPAPRMHLNKAHEDYGKLPDGRIVEQRWFVGSHGDVGGGCENSKLAQIPLAWMESQAVKAGLQLRTRCQIPDNAYMDPIYPSYERFGNGVYQFVRSLPLVGKGRYHRLVVTDSAMTQVTNPCLDPSVLDLWKNDQTYRPKGLGDIQHHAVLPWNLAPEDR